MTTEQETKPRSGGQHSYVLASIPVQMIELREQIRQDWDHDDGAEKMHGLTSTIKEWGILQPLLVKPTGNGGRFRLVAGHRRYKSAVEAGDLMVPCMIFNRRDEDIPLIQFIENTQRHDLSFANKAAVLQKLVDEGRSASEVSRLLCQRRRGYVNEILRVARVPELMSAIERGLIGESSAVAVIGLHDDYAASLLDLLREGQAVSWSMVIGARQQQQQDAVTKDTHAQTRGLSNHTKEQAAKVSAFRDKGLTIKEIAARLGVSKTYIDRLIRIYRYGPLDAPSFPIDVLRDKIAGFAAEGMSAEEMAIRAGCAKDTAARILKEIEHDAATTAEPNYFAQPDPSDDAPITNAARSLIPLRASDAAAAPSTSPTPANTTATSANTRPHPVQQPWENRAEDAGPRVTQATARPQAKPQITTGPLVTVDTHDYLVNEIRSRDTAQPQATAVPLTRHVTEPTLADLTVLLRVLIFPLLRLLKWASGKSMTAAQLHDEIKALYEL